jgi:hypothetical protein
MVGEILVALHVKHIRRRRTLMLLLLLVPLLLLLFSNFSE